MKIKNSYECFDGYIFRAPLFSVNFYKELTSERIISDDKLKSLFVNPVISESIFLATPNLYYEIEKWTEGKISDKKKVDKLKTSVLKYVSRMSSRSTPFGLFAGCCIGNINTNETKISLDNISKYKRHTRLDMNYLVALSSSLSKNEVIRSQINFYQNTSIYSLNGNVRYVEYEYIDGLRHHHIMGVENSIYLEKVLEASENGIFYSDLISLLIDEDNQTEVVVEFVNDLIDSQILISELEPTVSGPDFLQHIIDTLKRINGVDFELNILTEVKAKLSDLDSSIGNNVSSYIEISKLLENLEVEFDMKYLFQTDLILNATHNTISISVIEDLKKGLTFLNKITNSQNENFLKKFKDAFYERYEGREIALSKVMDVEAGIGYKQNQNNLDFNPLIDDLLISQNSESFIREVIWTPFNSLFQQKILEAYKSNDFNIVFKDSDIQNFKENWDDLPDTMSLWTEIVEIDGKEKILVGSCGASSSANVIARFSHCDEVIYNYVESIISFEKLNNPSKVLAEIVHLPESRIGNVIIRPSLRDYEIPYLAKSNHSLSNQIGINDLFLSVRYGKLFLRSKRLNKEVEPRLTNAHNFQNNSLPIYHFLCDMQFQNKRPSIGLYLGKFVDEYTFLPRIEYKNLILSEATWNLKTTELLDIFNVMDDEEELLKGITALRKKMNIPQYVLLIQSDHELLVNLTNITSISMFLTTVKNIPLFRIKEFLYSDKGIVSKDKSDEYFTNQVIFSFHKSKLHGE